MTDVQIWLLRIIKDRGGMPKGVGNGIPKRKLIMRGMLEFDPPHSITQKGLDYLASLEKPLPTIGEFSK